MLAAHRAEQQSCASLSRDNWEHISPPPTAPPPSHPGPGAASFGELSEAKLCGAFSLLMNPVSVFIVTQRKKTKIQKATHLPVVWTERRVRGITLGSFPAHEIPQELFYCLQCLPLTGKGMHVATWRAHSGDQDRKKKKRNYSGRFFVIYHVQQ